MSGTNLRLKDRIALVTGSTSGIGLSIAERLAQEGAKVIVSSRNHENVKAAVKQLSDKGHTVSGVVCHIGNREHHKLLVKEVEKLGGLDIFVQNAAVNPYVGPLFDCPESAWDKIFDVNLKSNFLITRELLPFLKKSKCGRVIYHSSLAAYYAYEKLSAYGISKTALLALTKMASLQLGKYNITVNCIAPGSVDTTFGDILMKDKFIQMQIENLSAMRRSGKVQDVSAVVAFLVSDDAAYISGETICISGGFPCRL